MSGAEGIIAIFIPIVGILSAPLIIWLVCRADSTQKLEVQKTIRVMVENGQTVSSELMESLIAKKTLSVEAKRDKDFRAGVILVALSIGIALFGVFEGLGDGYYSSEREMWVTDWSDIYWFLGTASIFLLLGLARLGLWKYTSRDNQQT